MTLLLNSYTATGDTNWREGKRSKDEWRCRAD